MDTEEQLNPIPLDAKQTVPLFPIECLPSPLKEYVEEVAEATQTPLDMGAVSSLSIMALCLQGKYNVQGKPNWIEPLNLYSVIVANPAERKSAVQRFFTEPVYQYERKVNEDLAKEFSNSKNEKEVLEKEIDKIKGDITRNKATMQDLHLKQEELDNLIIKKPIRLIADDITQEALATLMLDNKEKMSIVSAEGGIFELISGRYTGSVNMDIYLKSHSSDPINIDRKGRPSEHIKEPLLTMLLAIQPSILQEIMSNPSFKGRGLCARFLYSYPHSTIGSRKYDTNPIATNIQEEYHNLVDNFLSAQKKKSTLTLSPNAMVISKNFADKLEILLKTELVDIADWAGKLHGVVLRMAGILHCIEAIGYSCDTPFEVEEPISEKTMQNAITIGEYFLEHAKACYGIIGLNPEKELAKFVLKKFKDKAIDEKLTAYKIFRLCTSKFNKTEEIKPILEILIDHRQLLYEEEKYMLNPKHKKHVNT